MNIKSKILKGIPLFSHFTASELNEINFKSELVFLKKGKKLNLKKSKSLYVILNGVVQTENTLSSSAVYMSTGSYFGSIPFVENKQNTTISALIDSCFLSIPEEFIYKFFCFSFKAFRGYIKNLDRIGLGTSLLQGASSIANTKIISIYSPAEKSGKSLLSAAMAYSLSKHGKTVLLDLSYTGKSIFDYLNVNITRPFSQKNEDDNLSEFNFDDRLQHVNDNLSIFNIVHGSKIKVDANIIGPVLFALSKEYDYIIGDLSDTDKVLRNAVFKNSDYIFSLCSKKSDFDKCYDLFDRVLPDAQRVYYVKNEYNASKSFDFTGCLILPNFSKHEIAKISEEYNFSTFTDLITKQKKALFLESHTFSAIYFAGFLKAILEEEINFDYIYSSSFGYILSAIFVLSDDVKDFIHKVKYFFDENKFSSLLEITFPEKFTFKNNAVSNAASALAGKSRIEMYSTLPIPQLSDAETNDYRLFGTGLLADFITASFSFYPLFDVHQIGDSKYSSGYPYNYIMPSAALRSDVDEIVNVSISQNSMYTGYIKKILPYYLKHIEFNENIKRIETNSIADVNIIIDSSQISGTLKNIIDSSSEISHKLIVENKLK